MSKCHWPTGFTVFRCRCRNSSFWREILNRYLTSCKSLGRGMILSFNNDEWILDQSSFFFFSSRVYQCNLVLLFHEKSSGNRGWIRPFVESVGRSVDRSIAGSLANPTKQFVSQWSIHDWRTPITVAPTDTSFRDDF